MPTRQEVGEMLDSLRQQEGGDHYRKYAIQPVEYSIANKLSFCAGNVVKYVTRYRDKNGAEDIRKAIHYLNLILEFEYPVPPLPNTGYGAIGGGIQLCNQQQQNNAVGSVNYHENNSSGPKLILKLESEDPDTIGESLNALQQKWKP